MVRLERNSSKEERPRFNPIGKFMFDLRARRRARFEVQEDLRTRGEDCDRRIKDTFNQLNENCVDPQNTDAASSERILYKLDLDNLGAVFSTNEGGYSPYPANKIRGVNIPWDGHELRIHRDVYGRFSELPSGTWVKGKYVYQEGEVQQLEEIASKVERLADASTQVVNFAYAMDSEDERRTTETSCLPAVLTGKIGDDSFSISQGFTIKAAPEGDHDKRYQKIRVIQTSKTVYVITEIARPPWGSREKWDRTFPCSLRKYELEGGNYDPRDNGSAIVSELNENDIRFLEEVTKTLPHAEVTHWHAHFEGNYGEWETMDNILARRKARQDEERLKREQPPRDLSSEQSKAWEFVIEAVKKVQAAGSGQMFIYVIGMSGVGKSYLAEKLRPVITERGAIVVEGEDLTNAVYDERKKVRRDQILAHQGPIVILATVGYEVEKLKRRDPEMINQHVIKGMDEAETLERFQKHLGDTATAVPIERLVQYSAGILYLIDVLSRHPGLTESVIIAMVSNHLVKPISYTRAQRETIAAFFQQYLQIVPPTEVIDSVSELTHKTGDNIYTYLPNLLEKIDDLRNKKVIREDPPYFVTPATAEVYNQALALARKKQGEPRIEIYAPELTPEQYQKLAISIGFENPRDTMSGPRPDLFGVSARKTAVIAFSPDGRSTDIIRDVGDADEGLERLQRVCASSLSVPNRSWLFIHKHEHEGSEPIKTGHMLESQLQQKGIKYVVYNGYLEKIFLYNPEERTYQELVENPA